MPNDGLPQLAQRRAEPILTLSGHDRDIWKVLFLPGGQRLVTSSADKTIRIWNLVGAKQDGMPMLHGDFVYDFGVTNDGGRIVSGGQSGRMAIWNVETHELVGEGQGMVKFPRLSISDDRLVAYGNGEIIVIRELNSALTESERNIRSKSKLNGRRHTVTSLQFSPDNRTLASCVMDYLRIPLIYTIKLHAVESGQLIHELRGHKMLIGCLLWSHDGKKLYSASSDKTIRCWGAGTGKQIGEPWKGHTGWIYFIALSPDGTKLASASGDKTVRFWDTASGDPIGDPLQHEDIAGRALCFSPCGEFIALGLGKVISLWRVPWWRNHDRQSPQVQFPFRNLLVPSEDNTRNWEPELESLFFETALTIPPTRLQDNALHATPARVNHSVGDPWSAGSVAVFSNGDLDLGSFLPHPQAVLQVGPREGQREFERRLRKLIDSATARGFHIPHDIIQPQLSHQTLVHQQTDDDLVSTDPPRSNNNSPPPVEVEDTESSEPSTTTFRAAYDGDRRKSHKLEDSKQILIGMLRDIGLRVPKDRLPWSRLKAELSKHGYKILNWPQGVLREKDKGVYSLSAEQADKLYYALTRADEEQRIRFVRSVGDEPTDETLAEDVRSIPVASDSRGVLGNDHPRRPSTRSKFKITTADEYAGKSHKRRRIQH